MVFGLLEPPLPPVMRTFVTDLNARSATGFADTSAVAVPNVAPRTADMTSCVEMPAGVRTNQHTSTGWFGGTIVAEVGENAPRQTPPGGAEGLLRNAVAAAALTGSDG